MLRLSAGFSLLHHKISLAAVILERRKKIINIYIKWKFHPGLLFYFIQFTISDEYVGSDVVGEKKSEPGRVQGRKILGITPGFLR